MNGEPAAGHAGHGMEHGQRPPAGGHPGGAMPGMSNALPGTPGAPARAPAMPGMEHAGHDMAAMAGMDEREPGAMMAMHHQMVPWVDLILIGLGVWLLFSPATLGYPDNALTWSDIISGLLVIAFAALSYWGQRWWAPYGATLVGTWLIFAPLVFWAPDAASYVNDTLVGAFVIGLALLIPHGMPMGGPDIPAGWNYNPATWMQRAPIIVLGLAGFFISRYMAAYQLGHIDSVWDPFFGEGTIRILDSDISKMFPISDAGLGASVYLVEVLMVVMGDRRRWRTMPWMVAFFAILVIPLGVTSIVLVILQPLAVGTWCTVCLIAALAMLAMVPLTLDEVVAMGQVMARRRREGASLWRTFWLGTNVPEGLEARPVRPVDSSAPAAMIWGVTLPWSLVLSTLVGGWLLLAPAVLGSEGTRAADGDRMIGALVITVAMVALAEVVRPVRFLNVLFGAWLLVQPWLLGGGTAALTVSDLLAGVALIVLSLPRGPVRETYGGWDRYTH